MPAHYGVGMSRGGRRVRRVTMVLAFVVVALGLATAPAAAHDELVGTTPADGATVDTAPDQVVLTFAEPAVALGTQVLVTGPDGSKLSQGDAQLVGSTVVQALAADRPAGGYRVDWRVTSDDGHPVTGTFTFTATSPVPAATTAPPTTQPAPATASPTARPATPTPSASAIALPPGTQVDDSMPTTTSGSSTTVGILVLVLVVLALVVVRIGRAHSLRRIAATRAAADEAAGTGGTPGEE